MNHFASTIAIVSLAVLLCGCQPQLSVNLQRGSGPEPPDHPSVQRGDSQTLTWYEDNYFEAQQDARATDRPLVIDFWAYWCHTCLSMKHTVLQDPILGPMAERFVWLSINTDRPGNKDVVTRYPPTFWPTFLVVNPHDGSVKGRLQGSTSIEGFTHWLRVGETLYRSARGMRPALTPEQPLYHAQQGDVAAAAGDHQEAARAYESALNRSEMTWPGRLRVAMGRLVALYANEAWDSCIQWAGDYLDEAFARASPTAADFAYVGHLCLTRAEQDTVSGQDLRVKSVRLLKKMLEGTELPLTVDDLSEAMRIQRTMEAAIGEHQAALNTATAQRKLLDDAAASAETAMEAMTYNWPRAEVYQYLNVPHELVSDLEKSVAALPDAYDPPYRLAWILLKSRRPEDALPMAERALSLVYGPRRARVERLKAEIVDACGDKGRSSP